MIYQTWSRYKKKNGINFGYEITYLEGEGFTYFGTFESQIGEKNLKTIKTAVKRKKFNLVVYETTAKDRSGYYHIVYVQ